MNKLTNVPGFSTNDSHSENLSLFSIGEKKFCLYQQVKNGSVRIEHAIYKVDETFSPDVETFQQVVSANEPIFRLAFDNLSDYIAVTKADFAKYDAYVAFCTNNNTQPSSQEDYAYMDNIYGGIHMLYIALCNALPDSMLTAFEAEAQATKPPVAATGIALTPFTQLLNLLTGKEGEAREPIINEIRKHLTLKGNPQVTFNVLSDAPLDVLGLAFLNEGSPLTGEQIVELCRKYKSETLCAVALTSKKLDDGQSAIVKAMMKP